ncbi:MAG: DUF3089 domain-containing protein [Bacteroidota bacterium]
MRPYLFPVLFSILLYLSGCSDVAPPKIGFDTTNIPLAPVYTDISNWAAHPEKVEYSDTIPSKEVDLQGALPTEHAKADVFFIHPTTLMGGKTWNASVEDEDLNKKTESFAIKHQASIFNRSGRIYSPRYRQMALGGFYTEDKRSMAQALEVAYGDVKRAFEHYLAHENQGRPIIIASHSQGTVHGIRLVKEFFDGKELQDKLVCGYLIGWPFPQDTFKSIPVCNEPSSIGCVVGWCSWQKGKEPNKKYDGFYDNAVVVNPINWKADGSYAPSSQHKGFVGPSYKKIEEQKVDAQAHNGILWVSKPSALITTSNYHIGDLNLFWLDVRKNAQERVNAFLDKFKLSEEESIKK